jgi:hypothetical protein
MKLKDIASIIRSKNAGPYLLTIDILFSEISIYNEFKRRKLISQEVIKKLYYISEAEIIDVVYFDVSLAIKINLKRRIFSGSFGDKDIYGAQQHSPLLNYDIQI